jgi:hypothetical protein
VEKIKTHTVRSVTIFRKSCRLWQNVKKRGWATGVTNDVTIWRIRVACLISKATCAHPHVHANAPGQARTGAHTQIRNVYCFSTVTMVRECASILRYTYIVLFLFIVIMMTIMINAQLLPLLPQFYSQFLSIPVTLLSLCSIKVAHMFHLRDVSLLAIWRGPTSSQFRNRYITYVCPTNSSTHKWSHKTYGRGRYPCNTSSCCKAAISSQHPNFL